MQALVDEEDELQDLQKDPQTATSVGPCAELLLNEPILEKLAAMGASDVSHSERLFRAGVYFDACGCPSVGQWSEVKMAIGIVLVCSVYSPIDLASPVVEYVFADCGVWPNSASVPFALRSGRVGCVP